MNEDVLYFPVENEGDFPVCHVSFQGCHPERKGSYSYHPFSGAKMLVFKGGNSIYFLISSLLDRDGSCK